MAEVFISYSHEDRMIALRLAEALQLAGLSVWSDNDLPPGETINKRVKQEIAEAQQVVAIWSENAHETHYMQLEIQAARAAKKLVLVKTDMSRLPFITQDAPTFWLKEDKGEVTPSLYHSVAQDISRLIKNSKSLPSSRSGTSINSEAALPKNLEIAIVSAEKGDQASQYILGILYQEGLGVAKDYGKAASWFLNAARQGHIEAQVNLAQMYEKGWGLEQDSLSAMSWYEPAAARGHADAQYNLARLYTFGIGMFTDYSKGAHLYRLAADQGHAEAQFNLGHLSEYGMGVKQDYEEGSRWYRMAANLGHKLAQEKLALLWLKTLTVPDKTSEESAISTKKEICIAVFPNIARPSAQENLGANYPLHKKTIADRGESLKKFFLECETKSNKSKEFKHPLFENSSISHDQISHNPNLYDRHRILPGVGAIIIEDPDAELLNCISETGALILENYAVATIHARPSRTSNKPPNKRIVLAHQKSLENQDAGSDWHLEAINIKAARSKNLIGTNCLLGVVDTGIDASHPEFAGKKIWFGQFDDNGFLISNQPNDIHGHGTHVCGVATGITCGVAPAADLAVAGVFTKRSDGSSDTSFFQVLGGLDWLVTENFDDRAVWVSNISLGHPGYDLSLYERIRDMSELFGMTTIAAIGNEATSQSGIHSSPANYDNVIGVGATDQFDEVWTNSSRGIVKEHGDIEKPDLCAPGVDIRSCIFGEGYGCKSGTSMATAVVSSVAMLLLQSDLSLRGSPELLTERLFNLAKPFPGKKGMGRGRIDLTGI